MSPPLLKRESGVIDTAPDSGCAAGASKPIQRAGIAPAETTQDGGEDEGDGFKRCNGDFPYDKPAQPLFLNLDPDRRRFTGNDAIAAAFPEQLRRGGGPILLFTSPSLDVLKAHEAKLYVSPSPISGGSDYIANITKLATQLGMEGGDRVELRLDGEGRAVLGAVQPSAPPHARSSAAPIVVRLKKRNVGSSSTTPVPMSRAQVMALVGKYRAARRENGDVYTVFSKPPPGEGGGLGPKVGVLRCAKLEQRTRWYFEDKSGWLKRQGATPRNCLLLEAVQAPAGAKETPDATAAGGGASGSSHGGGQDKDKARFSNGIAITVQLGQLGDGQDGGGGGGGGGGVATAADVVAAAAAATAAVPSPPLPTTGPDDCGGCLSPSRDVDAAPSSPADGGSASGIDEEEGEEGDDSEGEMELESEEGEDAADGRQHRDGIEPGYRECDTEGETDEEQEYQYGDDLGGQGERPSADAAAHGDQQEPSGGPPSLMQHSPGHAGDPCSGSQPHDFLSQARSLFLQAQQFTVEMEELQSQKRALQRQNQQLQRQVEQGGREVADLTAQTGELRSQLAKRTKRAQALQAQNQALRGQVVQHINNAKRLRAENQDLRGQVEQGSKESERLQAENQGLRDQLELRAREAEETRQREKQAARERAELQGRYDLLRAEYQKLLERPLGMTVRDLLGADWEDPVHRIEAAAPAPAAPAGGGGGGSGSASCPNAGVAPGSPNTGPPTPPTGGLGAASAAPASHPNVVPAPPLASAPHPRAAAPAGHGAAGSHGTATGATAACGPHATAAAVATAFLKVLNNPATPGPAVWGPGRPGSGPAAHLSAQHQHQGGANGATGAGGPGPGFGTYRQGSDSGLGYVGGDGGGGGGGGIGGDGSASGDGFQGQRADQDGGGGGGGGGAKRQRVG